MCGCSHPWAWISLLAGAGPVVTLSALFLRGEGKSGPS